MGLADALDQLRISTLYPQPVATNYTLGKATIGLVEFVIVKLDDVTGSKVSFFTMERAKELHVNLGATISGLQVVTNQQPTQKDGKQ